MQNQIIFDTQMKTALTDYIITYLSPKSLTPVEHAALNCHVREDLAKYRPNGSLEVYSDLAYWGRYGEDVDEGPEDSSVIPLLSARHNYEQQGDLLRTFSTPDERIYRQQLFKRRPAQLERTINVPCFGSAQDIQLLIGREH